jgi:hypothetical protein
MNISAQCYLGYSGSRLGRAGAFLEPGGRFNLNSSANIPAGAPIPLRSNPLALSVLGTTYNGLPAISANSDGAIAIDAPTFDAITDLSKLGNGKVWLTFASLDRNGLAVLDVDPQQEKLGEPSAATFRSTKGERSTTKTMSRAKSAGRPFQSSTDFDRSIIAPPGGASAITIHR